MSQMDLDFHFKPIVLVTGFGPFQDHDVNASWEAVKLLKKEELEKKHNIELVTLELPVVYDSIDEFVPALWETHEPKLVIHVGVSGPADTLTLEMLAHRKGYTRRDYLGNFPNNNSCRPEGAIRIKTKLNVDKICSKLNEIGHKSKVSRDAGRYLCEYIYYKSLSTDNERSLFVHVPPIGKCTSEQTARGLEQIIGLCLQQIAEQSNEVCSN